MDYVPPNGKVLLIDLRCEVMTDYDFVLFDTTSVIEHKFQSVDFEDRSLYLNLIQMRQMDPGSFLNSCILIWHGDSKMYLAVGYAYETRPSYFTYDPTFNLYNLKEQKLEKGDDE